MNLYEAIEIIEEGAASHEDYIEAFQFIKDTGAHLQLQGFYGREVQRLTEAGEII